MITTIDQIIAEKLNSFVVNGWPVGNLILVVIALILSLLLSGIVGIERERRGRSAGLRTHLLVSVGSCIIMIISIYGFPLIFTTEAKDTLMNRDVARLAASIITGVGFLGAGAIIHRNSGTRGLTTAATIWIVMAIGLACGSFNFILAILGTILIILVLTVFRKIENQINKKAPTIVVHVTKDVAIMTKILELGKEYDCSIHDVHTEIGENDDNLEVMFQAVANNGNSLNALELLAKLEQVEGVISARVLNTHKM